MRRFCKKDDLSFETNHQTKIKIYRVKGTTSKRLATFIKKFVYFYTIVYCFCPCNSGLNIIFVLYKTLNKLNNIPKLPLS